LHKILHIDGGASKFVYNCHDAFRWQRHELLKSGSTTFSLIFGGSATAFSAFKVSAQKGLF
jgi:hypothetical protein